MGRGLSSLRKELYQHQAGLGQSHLSTACSRCEQTLWRTVDSIAAAHTGRDVGWKNCGMIHFVMFACFPQEVSPTMFPVGCALWELGTAGLSALEGRSSARCKGAKPALCQHYQAGKEGVCGEVFLSSGLCCYCCPCCNGDSSCL